MIEGKRITLVPATLDDRKNVYNWCYHSETSKAHVFNDTHIPSYEEFCADYADYYFDGSRPQDGRGYVIQCDEQSFGFISYCSFHLKDGYSELDIWMNSEANCGKGYGSDAIAALGRHISGELEFKWAIMRPSNENIRAIASYRKAGFEESNMLPEEYLLPEYVDEYGGGDYGEGGDTLLVWRL